MNIMYTFIIKDKNDQWFRSKLGFITKKEAEEEAAQLSEYEFVDIIKVLHEDDEELIKLTTYLN